MKNPKHRLGMFTSWLNSKHWYFPAGVAEKITDGMSLLEQLEAFEIFSCNDISQLRLIIEEIPRKDIAYLLDKYEYNHLSDEKESQKFKKRASEDVELPKKKSSDPAKSASNELKTLKIPG